MADDSRGAGLESAMERWEASLARMCFAYLGDAALAEDAVQETFLKAWKGYERFRGEAGEKTWLMRIAINTCKDVRRSAWFRHVDRSTALESLPEPHTPFSAEDDAVTRAVMGLRPKYREVVLLRWYQDLSGGEVAQVLKLPKSTVYNRLRKAYAILEKELEGWRHEV